jgi:tetratricopeptide (TPR) repeat protein
MNAALLRCVLTVVFALLVMSASFPTTSERDLTENITPGERPVQTLFQWEQTTARSGWTGESALQAGVAWKKLGNISRAVAYWEIASQRDPADADIWRALAESYINLQRWSLATIALTRIVELEPDDHWARYHLGLLQAAAASPSAIAHLRTIAPDSQYAPVVADVLLALESDNAAMQVGLTLARHDLWNYAELAFQHALTFDGPLPEACAYLGLARDRQGKDGSAAIEQAVSARPDSPLIRYLQGLHLRLRGNHSLSLDSFLRAATFDPANPAYAAELGTAYQLIGDSQLAEAWLRKAVILSGNDPRFQQLLDQFLSQPAG